MYAIIAINGYKHSQPASEEPANILKFLREPLHTVAAPESGGIQ